MSDFEVPEAIICSPFEEPTHYWRLEEGAEPEKRPGRRPAIYYYPDPISQDSAGTIVPKGTAIELKLVSLIRSRVKEWRAAGYPGVTATTLELLNYWRRDGRGFRFFFAQLEAAETIIFLNEARRDLAQGIDIPLDEPSEQQKAERGYKAFRRYACKMATGSGKTTVMGMIAA
jgi:type III restriction enzyme